MSISLDEVRRIAALAKLEFTEEELARFAATFSDIVAYVDRIAAVQLEADDRVPDTSFSRIILRPDELKHGFSVEEVLKNAPESEANLFTVPEVLKS